MLTAELDFDVPQELIAQRPVVPRDACRLLVLTPPDEVRHSVFRELPAFLSPNDVLVVNDSRVLRARVWAKRPTGGKVELLFLRAQDKDENVWEVMARPSRRLRRGLVVTVGSQVLEILDGVGPGRWLVRRADGGSVLSLLEEWGELPLPPYIHRPPAADDDYQTVYARVPGSAAAPTAGLHFTEDLLHKIRTMGCEIVPVTLHVGLDTFQPIKEARVEDHQIHQEHFALTDEAYKALARAREEGRRLVAVGTTVVRVLETVFAPEYASILGKKSSLPETDTGISGSTSLLITPGFRFRAVGGLITNLHLPRTTLVALVMAFAGVESIRSAYALAIRERYRFFSFGDAMFITRPAACTTTAAAADRS